MNFLKDSRTNYKYIVIVIILAFFVGGGILGYCYLIEKEGFKVPEVKMPEEVTGDEQKLAKSMITEFMNARMDRNVDQAKSYLTDNGEKEYSQSYFIDYALVGISNPHYSRYEVLKIEKLDLNQFKFVVRIYEYFVETKEKGDFQYFDEDLTIIKINDNYLVDSVKRGEFVIIQDETADWKTYRWNKECGNFEIKYSPDWKTGEIHSDELGCTGEIAYIPPGYSSFVESEEGFVLNLTYSETSAEAESHFLEIEEKIKKSPELSFFPGVLRCIREELKEVGETYIKIECCASRDHGVYLVSGGIEDPFGKKYENQVNQMLSTFRFLE